MATTTSNFGWSIPQSTDLVKDGATAIAALGNGIDTSMAELKGGTTGQILSKTSGTDMDFTWISSTPGDITGVTAGTGITGGGTSGDVTVSFDQANYGGGQYAAGKNKIINGGFDIWQRGTSFASGGYMCDRWTDSSSVSNMTASQQTSGAPNGSRYILRYTATAGSAYKDLKQYIETANVSQLWGKTVVFSIKMRRNATATGGNFNWTLEKSSTVDAGSGATWTSIVGATTTVASLTTGTTSADWTTVTISGSVPNDGTANSLRVTAGFSAVQASGSIIEFAQAQLEAGSTATPFQTASGSIGGELALCQRYYYRLNGTSNAGYANGIGDSSNRVTSLFNFPVSMRIAPTSVEYSNLQVTDQVNAAIAVTGVNLYFPTTNTGFLYTTVSSGITLNRPYNLVNSSTAGYVGVGAEL